MVSWPPSSLMSWGTMSAVMRGPSFWGVVCGAGAVCVAGGLIRLITVMGRERMSLWAAALLLAVGAIVLAVAWEYWFLTLTLVAAPYLLAAVTRRTELRADHHAVVAGFGPMLAEVLHMMQAAERESGHATASVLSGCGKTVGIDPGTAARGGSRSLSGKLLSSHPDYHTRLHHLAPHLERR